MKNKIALISCALSLLMGSVSINASPAWASTKGEGAAQPISAPCPGGWTHGHLADAPGLAACNEGSAELSLTPKDHIVRFDYVVPETCRDMNQDYLLTISMPQFGYEVVQKLTGNSGLVFISVPYFNQFWDDMQPTHLQIHASTSVCYVDSDITLI